MTKGTKAISDIAAFDSGERWSAVSAMITGSPLEKFVRIEARPGLAGTQVHEVHLLVDPGLMPMDAHELWSLVESVARHSLLDLMSLVAYYRGTDTGLRIVMVMMIMFSEHGEEK